MRDGGSDDSNRLVDSALHRPSRRCCGYRRHAARSASPDGKRGPARKADAVGLKVLKNRLAEYVRLAQSGETVGLPVLNLE